MKTDTNKKIYISLLISGVTVAQFVPLTHLVGNFAIFDVVIIIYFLSIFKRKVFVPKIILVPLFFGIISLVSYFSNINLRSAYDFPAGYILRWSYYAALVIAIASLVRQQVNVKYVIWGMIGGVLFTVLWAWYAWFLSPRYLYGIPMLHVMENTNFFVGRNYIGFYIIIGISLVLGLLINKNSSSFEKLILLLLISLFVTSSFLTFSKGVWLITSILFVSFVIRKYLKIKYFSQGDKIKMLRGFVIASLCVTVLIIIYIRYDLNSLVEYRINNSSYTNMIRVHYIIDSLFLMLNNPILGIGPKGYRIGAIEAGFLSSSDPHNAFLWVGSELGLVAFFMLILLIIHLYKQIIRISKTNESSYYYFALYQIFIVIMVHSFLSGLSISMKFFWIVLGVVEGINVHFKVNINKLDKQVR